MMSYSGRHVEGCETYDRLRSLSKFQVERAVEAVAGPHAQLLGSWHRGDFHLDARLMRSLSDVDVYDADRDSHSEAHLPLVIAGNMTRIRVSIHPENYEAGLRRTGRLWLGLLNLAHASDASPNVRDYIRAKTFLTFDGVGVDSTSPPHSSNGGFFELATEVKSGKLDPGIVSATPAFVSELSRLAGLAAAELGCHNLRSVHELDLPGESTGMSARFTSYVRSKFSPAGG
jgi:hypothetical protein